MLINANGSKCRKLTTKNFSLNLELLLTVASGTNLEGELKYMPPDFKRIPW